MLYQDKRPSATAGHTTPTNDMNRQVPSTHLCGSAVRRSGRENAHLHRRLRGQARSAPFTSCAKEIASSADFSLMDLPDTRGVHSNVCSPCGSGRLYGLKRKVRVLWTDGAVATFFPDDRIRPVSRPRGR
jgi:hypothetical protein